MLTNTEASFSRAGQLSFDELRSIRLDQGHSPFIGKVFNHWCQREWKNPGGWATAGQAINLSESTLLGQIVSNVIFHRLTH